MKNIFVLLSVSTLLFQILTIEIGLAQTTPQVQQIDRAELTYEQVELAQRYQDRGRGRSEDGDPQGAIAEFDRSVELNPNDPFTYYLRGLTKFKLKDKQGAINDMTTATELFRQNKLISEYQKCLKLIEEFKVSLAADKK
jgi:tetratricopeptide (TPR) repeat protein